MALKSSFLFESSEEILKARAHLSSTTLDVTIND